MPGEPATSELTAILATGRVRGAAELLVRGETETLLALARALVVDEAVAEAIVQSAVERSLPSLRDAPAKPSLRAWLAGAVVRDGAQRLRELGAALWGVEPATVGAAAADLAADPLLDDPVLLRRALIRLQPGDRALLVLHHGAGFGVEECGAAFALSAAAAEQRLAHARGCVAGALEELARADSGQDGPMTLPAPPPVEASSAPPRFARSSLPFRPIDPTLPDLGAAADEWGEATAVRPPEWLSAARDAMARDALGAALREHFGDPPAELVTRLERAIRALPA